MEISQAIILGIVQGITEWFPVSSSGHLVFLQQVFKIDASVSFDVFLHLGSLFALLIFFWQDIFKIIRAVIILDTKSSDFVMGIYIIIGTLPAALAGFFLKDFFESLFSSIFAVGLAFLVTGAILFLTRFASQNNKMSWKSSIMIGIAQAIAIIPGISRSGSTISTGMFLGLKKEETAKFAFLLAIPAIIGAGLVEFESISFNSVYILGFICAFAVGYISLFALMKIIKNGKLHYFSWYCFAIGIIAISIGIAG